MATITTRSLSGKDVSDKVAVKVNMETYEDKWGIIEVTLTSYTWGSGSTSGDYGNISVAVPNYLEDNDDLIVDNDALTQSGDTVSISQKYYFAVNNGVIGPAAKVNGDGSWDLIHLIYTQPLADNGGANALPPTSATLTYSVAFTDLTPSTTNPANTGTLTLKVNNTKISDSGLVNLDSSTYSGANGYVKAWINAMTNTTIDLPSTVINPIPNDLTPYFSVRTTGSAVPLITSAMSKISGTRTYSQQMFLFAINNGKVDANGLNIKATTSQGSFLEAKMEKLPDWPCDDHVTAAVAYTVAFTAIV